jgi:hypothetical protein
MTGSTSYLTVWLTAACLFAIAAPQGAMAQPFPQLRDSTTKPIASTGGLISDTGHVLGGTGFTAARKSTGKYFLQFPKGSFNEQPVFTCTPLAINTVLPVCNIAVIEWNASDHSASLEFAIYSSEKGAPINNTFTFTEYTLPGPPA